MMNLKENSVAGPCNIASKVLKECRDSLFLSVFTISKISLDSGSGPRNWICASTKATFKKGKRDFPLNYRLISLISLFSKLVEKNHEIKDS